MTISLKKTAAISLLALSSLSVNATIITGDLSYDNTGSKLITGTNGLTYLGWGEIASYNYAQTLAATQEGGLYESFHIASQSEASEFFSLATGTTAPTGNGFFTSADYSSQSAFGDNATSWISSAWFLADTSDGADEVGILSQYNNFLYMNNSWSSISFSDYFPFGSYNATWLLVSNDLPSAVPAPATIALLSLALVGFGFSRKQKKNL